MINQILTKLGLGDSSLNADQDTRRRYIRHVGRHAEVQFADRTYSLRDWSMGGVFFETAPDARIVEGDKINCTITFRFPHETVTIPQSLRVVRAAKRGIAAEFLQVSPEIRRKLQRVMDGVNTESFLESQAV